MSSRNPAFEALADSISGDLAYTHDSSGKLIYLNPFTADLWRVWQAASVAAPSDSWINVGDLLPETGDEVAVLCKPRRKNMRPPRAIAVFDEPFPGEPREWWSLETSDAVDVTYWMPLPTAL